MLTLEKWDESIEEYLHSIKSNVARGNYTEHTHRPTLKNFLEAVCSKIVLTNEPRRTECGAPDFVVESGKAPIGYIETKDVGSSLEKAEKSDQLKRYLSLPNFILTDYLEFRWYVNGVLREPIARIAEFDHSGKMELSQSGKDDLKNLVSGFLNANVKTVKDSRELANMLASMAKVLQSSIASAYEMETEKEELHTQLQSLREILISDLTPSQFADMISQTITYGLFVSRCYCENAKDFTREKSAYFIPKTNPFLRKLFSHIVGPDLNVRYAWIIDDIIDLLAKSDMDAVLKDFGKENVKDDPVVHFYETFLSVYDPALKEKRGVYYTPTPVVEYIVKSVDELVKRKFDLKEGLAEPSVLILDPACGTGTFLYSLVKLIRQSLKGQEGSWNDYISQNLLERVYGFELLMAPYVVAHLKLSLELKDSGYTFEADKRLGIYLTNSLEEGLRKSEVMFAKWLSDEANAATEIKRDKPIMIVLGNPPYSGHSANKGDWIRKLVHDYRQMNGKDIDEKQIKWLQDDYVKFIRFGQWRIERSGRGIIGFVTNHAYLDNPTFRAMRKNLVEHFDEIYVLNLHGNKYRCVLAPDGSLDENVFDIRQGVAIGIFVKHEKAKPPASVYYSEIWGGRDTKYSYLRSNLISTTEWKKLDLNPESYYFVPTDRTLETEYNKGYSLTEIFPVNNVGFVTSRDDFAINRSLEELQTKMNELRDPDVSDQQLIHKHKLHDTSSWELSKARHRIRTDQNWKKKFTRCLYRPFDVRHIFFSKDLLERPVMETSGPLLVNGNIALVGMRQVAQEDVPYTYFSVACYPIDNRCFRSNKGIVQVFPLYVFNTKGELVLNLSETFTEHLCKVLNKEWTDTPKRDRIDPLSVFYYITALVFSDSYRVLYSELLRRDFPKIPIISDYQCFKDLAELGRVVSLNLVLNESVVSPLTTKFPVQGTNRVERRFPVYESKTERVYLNDEQYFEGIQQGIWLYQLGGRQVLFEWLKERRGSQLTYDEKATFQKIVEAIRNLLNLSEKIDSTLKTCPKTVVPKIEKTAKTLSGFSS